MATKTELKDLGRMNDWKTRPDLVQQCMMACHNTPHLMKDIGLFEVQCATCGYTYRRDDTSEFRNPAVRSNPVQAPPPEPVTPPTEVPESRRFVTASEVTQIAMAVAQGVVKAELVRVGILPREPPEDTAAPDQKERKPTRFEEGHVLR